MTENEDNIKCSICKKELIPTLIEDTLEWIPLYRCDSCQKLVCIDCIKDNLCNDRLNQRNEALVKVNWEQFKKITSLEKDLEEFKNYVKWYCSCANGNFCSDLYIMVKDHDKKEKKMKDQKEKTTQFEEYKELKKEIEELKDTNTVNEHNINCRNKILEKIKELVKKW